MLIMKLGYVHFRYRSLEIEFETVICGYLGMIPKRNEIRRIGLRKNWPAVQSLWGYHLIPSGVLELGWLFRDFPVWVKGVECWNLVAGTWLISLKCQFWSKSKEKKMVFPLLDYSTLSFNHLNFLLSTPV